MQRAGTCAGLPLLVDTAPAIKCLWMQSVPPPPHPSWSAAAAPTELQAEMGGTQSRRVYLGLCVAGTAIFYSCRLPVCFSSSVFICGLHLHAALLLQPCLPAEQASLGDTLWSNCENGVFSHKEAFIAELLCSSVFCAVNGDGCE